MITLPEQLKDDRLRFIILKRESKQPHFSWKENPSYVFSFKKLAGFLSIGYNYALLCGRGIIVIDIDSPGINEEVKKALPPTFTVKSGGKGGYHLYFFTDDTKTERYDDPKGKRVFDVQGDNTYIVAPNSVHSETKKPYEVVYDLPIASCARTKISKVLRKYGKAMHDKTEFKKKFAASTILSGLNDRLSIRTLLNRAGINATKTADHVDCPMHTSNGHRCFSYDDLNGLWNCWHCGKKGNRITLWRELNGAGH